jgi:hypothetical protein
MWLTATAHIIPHPHHPPPTHAPVPPQTEYPATGYPASYPTAQPTQSYPPPPAGYPGTYPPQAPYGQQQQQPWGQPAAAAGAGYGTIEMGAPGGSSTGMYPQVNAGVGAGTNYAPPPAGYPSAGQQKY